MPFSRSISASDPTPGLARLRERYPNVSPDVLSVVWKKSRGDVATADKELKALVNKAKNMREYRGEPDHTLDRASTVFFFPRFFFFCVA